MISYRRGCYDERGVHQDETGARSVSGYDSHELLTVVRFFIASLVPPALLPVIFSISA